MTKSGWENVSRRSSPTTRVLIADDEMNARIMLKSLLEECDTVMKTSLVGEVDNGKTLVSMVHKTQPDLVFVDIKMPLCNGLEAIRDCVNTDNHIQWVIISGFSEFDYAHQALRLGVVDYLLKPVEPEKLKEVLKKVKRNLIEEYTKMNSDFERRCEDVLIKHEDSSLLFYGKETHYCWIFFRIDLDSPLRRSEKETKRTTHGVHEAMKQSLNPMLSRDLKIATVPIGDKTLLIIVSAGNQDEREESLETALFRHIEKTLQETFTDSALPADRNDHSPIRDKVLWSVTSARTKDIRSLDALLKELQDIASLRALHGRRNRWQDGETIHEDIIAFADTFHRILTCFSEKEYIAFIRETRLLESLVKRSEILQNPSYQQNAWEFLDYTVFPELKDLPDTSLPRDWKNLCYSLRTFVAPSLKNGHKPDTTIQKIIQFIDTHYMENIGVNTVADLMDVSPNYLSTLFRKECKKTFTAYITEVRLKKAKQLMEEKPHLSIRTVSAQIGYHSPRYFTKQFFRYMGVYPSVYKKRGL